MTDKFSEASQQEIQQILTRYPTKQAALLPVLWVAQREFGWISAGAMELVARTLDLSPAHVYGVVTFYTMFHTEPVGRHLLEVCQTLPCALMGCGKITDHLKGRLGLEIGQTSADGRWTVRTVECLASCGTAPAMRIDGRYHENLDPERLDQVLEGLK